MLFSLTNPFLLASAGFIVHRSSFIIPLVGDSMPKRIPILGWTLAVALIIALAAPLLPRALPPATASQKAVRELAAVAPIEVKWNEATGTPDWLDGPLPYALSRAERTDPELAARNALNHYRDIFGIENAFAAFQLVRIETDSLGQSHVRLQQV